MWVLLYFGALFDVPKEQLPTPHYLRVRPKLLVKAGLACEAFLWPGL